MYARHLWVFWKIQNNFSTKRKLSLINKQGPWFFVIDSLITNCQLTIHEMKQHNLGLCQIPFWILDKKDKVFVRKKWQNWHTDFPQWNLHHLDKNTEVFSHVSNPRVIYQIENAQNCIEFLLWKKILQEKKYSFCLKVSDMNWNVSIFI